jgi:type I restriction-modification system DNA methylase subunit
MIPKTFEDSFLQVKELAARFGANESAFLSPRYQEAEVRQDFLDKFWVALGWDVHHEEHPNPYEREVKIEKGVMVENRGKRADYAFFTSPNFLQARFMAEAKKPARQLKNPNDCFQAMRYGWNANTPLAVLTDFEQFLVLDSRYKPSVEKALNGLLADFHYTQFSDEETFRKIYYLFSREAVGDNSLEKFIQTLKKPSKAKKATLAPAIQIQPVGDTFLGELDVHRDELARAFKRARTDLGGDELTEITQRTLDRLVFIRFLEDKLVEPSEIIDRLGSRGASAWRDLANEIPRLNKIYNGTIFKEHSILDAPDFEPAGKAFTETVAWLSHKNSAYDFNTIPIHILGSIYERFLGKTINDKAQVEEKPEVRKAGGVYYTPEYIVSYIVENTIGALLQKPARSKGAVGDAGALTTVRASATGATPDEIAKMRFADIACGSGSFLLGMFDYVIKYHVEWYGTNKTRRADAIKSGLCRETADGSLQLTLEHKRDILLNNIYGVDLDAQAVEVAQLSLYLKLLEEENAATVQPKLGGLREQLLPSLNKNIVHGNSLIDYDIMEGQLFDSRDLRKLNPMSFKDAFPEVFANGGFDAIVGNPPYIRIQGFPEEQIRYFSKRFQAATGNFDIYVNFIEKAFSLLKASGLLGQIVPNKFFKTDYGVGLRGFVTTHRAVSQIVDFGANQVFEATIYTCLFFLTKSPSNNFRYASAQTSPQALEELVFESFEAERFEKDSWVFVNLESLAILRKLNQNSKRLLDLPAEMSRGSSSGNDDVFMVGFLDDGIENDITRIPVFATDFSRYSFVPKYEWKIIFPYLVGENGIETIPESDLKSRFPKSHEYLSRNRDELAKRKQFKEWYGYSAPRNLMLHERAQILIPLLANRGLFSLVPAEFRGKLCPMASGGFTITLDPKTELRPEYILGLLNSRLLFWKLQNESNLFRGGWITCTKQYFGELPIHTINFDDPNEKAVHDRIVGSVERMIEAKKNLADARTDRDRQIFERLCTTLDTQIDELVYQLYGLTDEEIRVVENNK